MTTENNNNLLLSMYLCSSLTESWAILPYRLEYVIRILESYIGPPLRSVLKGHWELAWLFPLP